MPCSILKHALSIPEIQQDKALIKILLHKIMALGDFSKEIAGDPAVVSRNKGGFVPLPFAP